MALGNPLMTLKQFNFTPTVGINFAEYKSNRPDSTILPKSLQTQEARAIESRNANNIISQTFGKDLRPNLDVSELPWLDAREDAIHDRIKTQIELGNTESAIRIGQEEADAIASDRALQYKMKANKERQDWLKGINSQNRSALSKRYIEAINPYYDDGTGTWKPKFAPEYEIELNKLQQLANAFTAGSSGGHTGSGQNDLFLDENGNKINLSELSPEQLASKVLTGNANLFATGHSSSGYNFSKKTAEEMAQTFRDILNEPKFAQALTYTFNSTVWGLKEAEKLLNDPNLDEAQRMQAQSDYNELKKLLSNKDGIIYSSKDYSKWLDDKVVSMFTNMAYNNINTSESSSTTYHSGGTSGGGGGNYTDITELGLNRENTLIGTYIVQQPYTFSTPKWSSNGFMNYGLSVGRIQ